MSLSIDFETRSTVDLLSAGIYRYAADPTTQILCMAYAFDDEEVRLWVPGDPIPADIEDYLYADTELRAHNAQFERIIWREILGPRHGFPPVRLDQWVCTAAEAAAMSLPRALGQVAAVLKVDAQKDDSGHRLMMQMCKPRKILEDGTVTWWEDEGRLSRLYDYCKQDVEAERAVAKKLRRLSDHERHIYLLDQRINDRGVCVDLGLVRSARHLVTRSTARANADIRRITGGAVSAVTKVADLKAWVNAQGVEAEDMTKATVRDLLDAEGLEEAVSQALQIRQDAGKSSVSKLDAFLRVTCEDSRARGLLLYHGASTGRWASRLIQIHNLVKGDIKGVERFIPLVLEGSYSSHKQIESEAPALSVVSSLLRAMLTASPDHRLIAGDYGQIEARVLGWIAEEPYGVKEYEKMAALIYGMPLADIANPSRERDLGKAVILGAGFGMGAEKFQSQTAKTSGIVLTEEMAEKSITTYRSAKPGIPAFWKAIQNAAMGAVRNPGKVFYCGLEGKIKWVVRGQFLWCILPSGRPLAYARPSIYQKTFMYKDKPVTSDALRCMGLNSVTRKWQRQDLYGGLLTENVVQAMARDLMAEAMLRLEEAGYPVVLTVHDEVIADVPKEHGSVAEFLKIMEVVPAWAKGCPVVVEGSEMERYRK